LSLLDQYIVEVNDLRTAPRFTVYKVDCSSPVDTSSLLKVTSGSSVSIQETEPNGVSTFTLSVSEP